MPTQTLDPAFHGLLSRRYIATLGTENADGSIHLTAVWYLFESGSLYVATLFQDTKGPECGGAAEGFADGGRAKAWDGARPHGGEERWS